MSDLIKQAENLVQDAGLDSEAFREPAFREALRHLLRESPIDGGRVPLHRSLVPTHTDGEGPSAAPELGAVAAELGIESEAISSVLTITPDAISLEVPTDRLPTAKADAAREVAVVFAAVNRALGREARTSEVRSVLRDYGRFDSPNFASTIRKIPAEHLAVKGRPGSRDHELIIRRGGIEEAARIVARWSGTA